MYSVPGLENAEYDPVPFVQGLRPFRGYNVRVEHESRLNPLTGEKSRIIHSYGHGGSGFTLSFGSAVDVLGLVREVAPLLHSEKMVLPMEMAEAKM